MRRNDGVGGGRASWCPFDAPCVIFYNAFYIIPIRFCTKNKFSNALPALTYTLQQRIVPFVRTHYTYLHIYITHTLSHNQPCNRHNAPYTITIEHMHTRVHQVFECIPRVLYTHVNKTATKTTQGTHARSNARPAVECAGWSIICISRQPPDSVMWAYYVTTSSLDDKLYII